MDDFDHGAPDDGLPAAWVCVLAVVTMPLWLPPVWLISYILAGRAR